MLVVAKNFVGSSGIQNWQLVHALKNFVQMVPENLTPALLCQPRQTLFQGPLNSAGQGFSRLGC